MSEEPTSLKRINSLGDSELVIAGRNGDLDGLRRIFKELIDKYNFSRDDAIRIFAHHSNRLGKTVLHEAAQNSRVECVRYLVGNNSENDLTMDPDCLKQGDWTPLMLACTKDSLDIIQLLVEAGASLNLRNKDGWTPFHIACREGHEDVVSYFLDLKSQKLWDTKSKNGRTPLHTAALYGREKVVDLLLQRHAYNHTDDADTCGSTPLMDALRSGHVEIAKRIIAAGADFHKNDAAGRLPIHLAAQTGRAESVTFLVEAIRKEQQQQCSSNDIDENKVIHDAVNVKTVDEFHCTPVYFAAKEGHVEILKLLSAYGARLDIADSKGRTPLHMAVSGQHAECVEYLLAQHVQDTCDSYGISASQLAMKPTVKQLFEQVV